MKKSVIRIGAILFSLVILFGTMTAMASQVYPDLSPKHWCYKKIMEFVDKGYIDGYEDGTMRPNQTITRAEYVKVVNNFFGFKDAKTDKKFSDVSDDAWYAKYVYAAVAEGYISGYEDNTFRPENPITRQEATVILSRILKIDKEVYPKDHVDGLAQYSDGNEVADWAYTPIHSYSVYNFINGYEDGTLRILQNVTRAETVELLHVLEQKIEIDRPYGKTKTTKMPTINVVQVPGWNEYIPIQPINGWFNKEKASTNNDSTGIYVNITTTTDGATIYEKVNPRNPEDREYITTTANEYTNMFFLEDGIYDVSAYAKKVGRKASGTNKVTLKVDTKAPYVIATVLDNETNPKSDIAHTQKIKIELRETIPSNLTEKEVSGINETSAKYAWFIKSGEEFVRATEWTALSNNQTVETPKTYGKYKLAVSVKDNAENSFGELIDGDIKYDFVEDKEKFPPEDIIVEVGNNVPEVESLKLYTKLGIAVSGDILATDADSGDKLTYEIISKPESGDATVDENGKTIYTPAKKGTFTYEVKVSDGNGGEAIATVTVEVEELIYTVNYLEKGTNTVLKNPKVVDNQFFGTAINVSGEIVQIDGYNYDSVDKAELVIGLSGNVINLYYTKRTDLSYTVNYLEKETNKVLEKAKVVEGQIFGSKVTENAEEINGYNKVAPTSGEIEITTGTNEITFYYTKRADLSYTVKYLEKETEKVLKDAKVVEGQTFGSKVTENAEEIDGYNKVAPTSGEIEITTGTNEITFYYTKRTDLSYTVNYYLEGTTTKVATSKTVTNKTLNEEVTETAINVTGYTKVDPTTATITISADESKNVINFYYAKRTDLSYTVNYYLEGTTTKVATSKTVPNKTLGAEVTENAADVTGYTKVDPTTATITISADESKNVINFYYKKNEGKLIANIACNYPTKGGVKAEPGDTLKYTITLEEENNTVDFPKTITIKLDADVEKPTNLSSNATYDETTHTITWKANSKDDKLTYSVRVKEETKAGAKVETKVTGATAEGATSVDIESTVSVKVDKNKNVVLVLDISGSMDWCVKHGEDFRTASLTGKRGHGFGLGFYACSEQTRLDAMKESAKNFAESIIDERNSEDITITIITFANDATNEGTLLNPTTVQINKVIDGLSAYGGTNMKGAINAATTVLNSEKMLENAVDYVVVLSDGDPEADEYYCDSTTLNAFYATKANAYAIGLGNSYKKDELLKIVNNDSNKVFDAANADKLEEAFKKIGSEINKAQTAEGEIDVNVTGIVLYPIKLSYKDTTSKTVTVTINSESELTANNLSIKDGKLVWDISKYPGCKGFQIEVNRTKATAMFMLLSEEYGLEDEILAYGDPSITDELPKEEKEEMEKELETSGDEEVRPTESKTSGDEEVEPTEPKASGDEEVEPTEPKASGDEEVEPTEPKTSGDEEVRPTESKTSGDEEVEPTEPKASGDEEVEPTEQKTSGDEEVNEAEQKTSDDEKIKEEKETSGDTIKEDDKMKTEDDNQEKTEISEKEEKEDLEQEKSKAEEENTGKVEENLQEKIKATVEDVIAPEIKDPLEKDESDEKVA